MTDAARPVPVSRIDRIRLENVRAFPASQPGEIACDGKNLLLYGENGSGKSSIYRALREMFRVPQLRSTADIQNVFTPDQPSLVSVTLTDGTSLVWQDSGPESAAVADIGRRAAFLSHTRLREMNYNVDGPDEAPEWGMLAIRKLVGDYEAAVSGLGVRTIADLWNDFQTAIDARVFTTENVLRRPKNYLSNIDASCDRLNEGLKDAVDALEKQSRTLLTSLLDATGKDGLEITGLVFTPAKYDRKKRTVVAPSLRPNVKFRDYRPGAHQSFLNEARQSALAIAVYLGGRLACVPKVVASLRLLVLDDLLISLDASHRRAVLETITAHFEGWQILLLTHDRYWFELAREQLDKKAWAACELFERRDGSGLLTPFLRLLDCDAVEAALKQAEAFLAEHHAAAAANYARSACELALRRFCEKRNVAVPYVEDKKPSLETFLQRAKADLKDKSGKDDNDARLTALEALDQHKKFVLNPFSHDAAVPVPEADVRAAIAAVREVARACGKNYGGPAG